MGCSVATDIVLYRIHLGVYANCDLAHMDVARENHPMY